MLRVGLWMSSFLVRLLSDLSLRWMFLPIKTSGLLPSARDLPNVSLWALCVALVLVLLVLCVRELKHITPGPARAPASEGAGTLAVGWAQVRSPRRPLILG